MTLFDVITRPIVTEKGVMKKDGEHDQSVLALFK